MKPLLRWAAAGLVALVLGLGSAVWMVRYGVAAGMVRNGDAGARRVVRAPSNRGLVLVRRVVESPAHVAAVDALRRGALCAPLDPRSGGRRPVGARWNEAASLPSAGAAGAAPAASSSRRSSVFRAAVV